MGSCIFAGLFVHGGSENDLVFARIKPLKFGVSAAVVAVEANLDIVLVCLGVMGGTYPFPNDDTG